MLTETAREETRASLTDTLSSSEAQLPTAAVTHLEVRLHGTSAVTLQSAADAVAAMPALSTIVVHPGQTDRDEIRALGGWLRQCSRTGLRVAVDFVLDGDADGHAALARRPTTSLTAVLDASRTLRINGVRVRWWVPIVPALVYRLESLFSLADDEGVEPVLVESQATHSKDGAASTLDDDALRFVRDFVMYRLLEEEGWRLSTKQRESYDHLLDSLRGQSNAVRPRRVPVAVFEFDERGSTYRVRQETRTSAEALMDDGDDSSTSRNPVSPGVRGSEVADVLAEGLRAVGEWGKSSAIRAGRSGRQAGDISLPRVPVIGAYGGEHIGDAAILGGVLLRIHRRHGTREAILVSQRPDHTAHLIPMLDTPVRIRVEEYRQSTVGGLLEQVDGVVFAGGPLMDLPKQLVKHLYAVALARRAGKPFVLEGIGAGPFVRWPSAWTARRLACMAHRITVRTSDDGRAPLVRGLHAEVGRDPAFDYLETRRDELTRLPEIDRLWVERLLKDTEGRVTIGLNLRPIRPDYTTDTIARRRVEYTRFVETRFEARLTEAMRQFHKASTRPPCFVFFPMNAIQFGLSDLRSAYRLQRLLRGDVDFRVWEGDATIDGVVALLRRLDIAITMRFHATIYALVQQLNVIGIDYRVGRRDKVAALLGDFGRSNDCARIDEMTTDWMLQRLTRLSQ